MVKLLHEKLTLDTEFAILLGTSYIREMNSKRSTNHTSGIRRRTLQDWGAVLPGMPATRQRNNVARDAHAAHTQTVKSCNNWAR